jgi:Sirohaem biosynthesis protein C-terminal
MIGVCQKYSLDQLVKLNDADMDRLLLHYKEGTVPDFTQVHPEENVSVFDGSFGWHC